MNRPNAYREADILSASPQRLLVLTYDALLGSLARFRAAAALGQYEVAGTASAKARAILCELIATLDRAAGGTLARDLAALYAFLLTEVDAATLRRDSARLDRITAMVRDLRDAFAEAVVVTGAQAS
jgi:flagellar protein FliS